MVLLSVDKDIRLSLDYGRPSNKLRRWYLTATCRETGRWLTSKHITKPTAKEIRYFKSYAKQSLKDSLYWSEL